MHRNLVAKWSSHILQYSELSQAVFTTIPHHCLHTQYTFFHNTHATSPFLWGQQTFCTEIAHCFHGPSGVLLVGPYLVEHSSSSSATALITDTRTVQVFTQGVIVCVTVTAHPLWQFSVMCAFWSVSLFIIIIIIIINFTYSYSHNTLCRIKCKLFCFLQVPCVIFTSCGDMIYIHHCSVTCTKLINGTVLLWKT